MRGNKGQVDKGMGIILVAFIGIIVALLLYQSMGEFIGTSTGANLATVSNQTITSPAVGSSIDLSGQEIVTTPVVTNATGGEIVPTTNYTIVEKVDSTGVKGIVYTSSTGGTQYAGKSLNVSYKYYPDGYIDDAGGRGLTMLIPIFAALAIGIIALVPALRNGVLDLMRS